VIERRRKLSIEIRPAVAHNELWGEKKETKMTVDAMKNKLEQILKEKKSDAELKTLFGNLLNELLVGAKNCPLSEGETEELITALFDGHFPVGKVGSEEIDISGYKIFYNCNVAIGEKRVNFYLQKYTGNRPLNMIVTWKISQAYEGGTE
jgi:hypothetical protein